MDSNPHVYVPVLEDWCPCFKITWGSKDTHLVRVTLHESCLLQPTNPFIRVSIWGADDLGMDKDYAPGDIEQARTDYVKVMQQRYPTRKWLASQGFNYC